MENSPSPLETLVRRVLVDLYPGALSASDEHWPKQWEILRGDDAEWLAANSAFNAYRYTTTVLDMLAGLDLPPEMGDQVAFRATIRAIREGK